MAPPKTPQAPRGTISGSSSHSVVRFTIRAIPLPNTVTSFLQANISIIKRLQKDAQNQQGLRDDHTRQNGNGAAEEEDDEEAAIADGDVVHKPTVRLEDFWTTLDKLLTAAGNDWKGVADRIWTFGPKRVGPNILIDRTTSTTHS
jgi:ribosome assembly protein 1